jgi:hypothetical protein
MSTVGKAVDEMMRSVQLFRRPAVVNCPEVSVGRAMDKIASVPQRSVPDRRRDRIWFRCTSCRDVHRGYPEITYDLPEAIAVLDRRARLRRVMVDGDVAILDGTRYFLRANLTTKVHGCDDDVTWGVWVETGWTSFKLHWQRLVAEADGSEPGPPLRPFSAKLASTIAVFGTTRGLAGAVANRGDGLRPAFTLKPQRSKQQHALITAQVNGVSSDFALEQARKVGVFIVVS